MTQNVGIKFEGFGVIKGQILPATEYFALIEGPHEHKQHQNQQGGLDLYVRVLNIDTGEVCHKKLYRNSKGLHFKHTGYPPTYLDQMHGEILHVPYQTFEAAK